MADSSKWFEEILEEKISRTKGRAIPVRSGFLRCLLVRQVSCSRLHPNPDDEFCRPEVGPAYPVISQYEHQFANTLKHSYRYCDEPLTVERIYPEGYMILNGHHRWAAAVRLGYKKIPVKIVNLTQTEDIYDMLRRAKNSRRVTLDLDEVVFCREDSEEAEKALPFHLKRLYPERLRRGIPGLFYYLAAHGYDVWVYSAGYYSLDYIKYLFRHYHAPVTGIVTGTGRKRRDIQNKKKEIQEEIAKQYSCTIHIDREMLLKTAGRDSAFEEYRFSGDPDTWVQEILSVIGGMEK